MNLNLIIAQLRDHCPSFEGRVAGAARFKTIDETANLAIPAAYVIPLDDQPGERMSLNDVRQPLIESFAIIVAISNTPDERGQAAINSAHDTIRQEIWQALLGFQPDAAIYRGIEYQGGNLLELDRSRLWYQFDFGAYMEIGPEDGWQGIELGALPSFYNADIDLNLEPPPAPQVSHIVTAALEFSSAASFTLFNTGLTDVLDKIYVIVNTAFNGDAPTLTIGIPGVIDKYLQSGHVDLKTPGTYRIHPRIIAQGQETIKAYFTGDDSTEGSAIIQIYDVIP